VIIAIGVLLIGGHLLLVMALANVFAASFGNWSTLGLMVLMGFAIYSGLWILKFQTWLEGYFIRRQAPLGVAIRAKRAVKA